MKHSKLVIIIVSIEETRVLVNVPNNKNATGVRDADVEFVWLGISLDMNDIATLAGETRLLDAFGTQHLPLVPIAWSANDIHSCGSGPRECLHWVYVSRHQSGE